MKKIVYLNILFFVPFFLSAQTTIVDIIVESPDHEILESFLIATELDLILSNEDDTLTILAPTDAAFNALPEGVLDELLTDSNGELQLWLLNHIMREPFISDNLSHGQVVQNILFKNYGVSIVNGDIFIGDALITTADLSADNGTVHVIDAVLPPSVFSVYDVIRNSSSHKMLEAGLIATGLNSALDTNGPFTVFAPTDDAFDALPAGFVDALLADPGGDLTDVLLYHVLSGDFRSEALSDGQMATTLEGTDITVSIENGNVFFNNAQVTVRDILSGNGVVHVIDAVLLPDGISSTNELELGKFEIFPNPVDEYLQVFLEELSLENARLNLLSVEGKQVKTFRNLEGPLNVSEVRAGVYFLEFQSGQMRYIKKLIVN